MSKAQFPQNWATSEIIKQYMRNHCHYEVKKGWMMPCRQRSAAFYSRNTSQLHNDNDNDEDMVNENDDDENGG
jgi:hypothetical protein